jgi:hypothetical protein
MFSVCASLNVNEPMVRITTNLVARVMEVNVSVVNFVKLGVMPQALVAARQLQEMLVLVRHLVVTTQTGLAAVRLRRDNTD